MSARNILISAYGKFDLFRWAEGFSGEGILYRLLTDFYSPKSGFLKQWRVDSEKIPIDKVHTLFLPRALQQPLRALTRSAYWDNALFDAWAARNLGEADVVISRSSVALATFRQAKKLHKKTVLYRGSSHIEYFDAIRREEAELWNVPYQSLIDERSIAREKEEYAIADYFYVPSTYALKTYIDKGIPAEKMLTFPLSAEAISGREKISSGVFTILYVGNISIYKGIPYLLRAVEEIKKEKNVKLVLAGSISSEMKPILARYQHIFTYAGIVPHHEVGELYAAADAFVFPSIDDGFGQVMLEAMGYGVPVIASTHSAGLDIIRNGENGFVVPIRNAAAIRDRILELEGDREKAQSMGRASREIYEHHSIRAFTENWIHFFKRAQWM